MRNKETGEFELVVGDKQLLSGFFIGVLLLAVVFAMGYVLGRGTPKSASVGEPTAVPQNAAAESRPAAVPSAQRPSTPDANPAVMNPDVGHPDDTPAAEQAPQPTTVPAKEVAAPEPPAAIAKAPVAAAEPPAGSYWQVHAGSQTSAEAMAQTLKNQGFPVITRPGRDNLTLVWVGPYSDKASLTKAKKQLEDAGMTNLFKKP
jgi:cell division septation protein DedD